MSLQFLNLQDRLTRQPKMSVPAIVRKIDNKPVWIGVQVNLLIINHFRLKQYLERSKAIKIYRNSLEIGNV